MIPTKSGHGLTDGGQASKIDDDYPRVILDLPNLRKGFYGASSDLERLSVSMAPQKLASTTAYPRY
jgi:hypothetical protein